MTRRILDPASYSHYEAETLLSIVTIEPSDAIANLGFLLRARLPGLVEHHTARVVCISVNYPFTETRPPQN